MILSAPDPYPMRLYQYTGTNPPLPCPRPLAVTMPQQKLSAFFSTSKTPPKPSPVRTAAAAKTPPKPSPVRTTAAAVIIEEDNDVDEAVVEVKRVRISSDVREVSASPLSSPPSSPVNQSKRRRVQILESDDESENEENQEPKAATPKRATAKLSKAFRSKIANRVQTPFVKKEGVEEDAKPSPIASRLASFAFKKNGTEDKKEEVEKDKEEAEEEEGKMEVEEEKSPKSEPVSPTKSPSPAKSPSPVKKTPVSNKKSKPKAEKKTPKAAKKAPQSSKKTPESVKKTPETSKKTTETSKKTPELAKKTTSLVSAGSAKNYNPGKSSYSPISDASWSKGQDVPYCALTDTLKVGLVSVVTQW
eukprot:sb/3466016/